MGDAGREGKAKGRGPTKPTEIGQRMDQLSLEQALDDAEQANRQVIELTRQLVTARAEISRLQGPGPLALALASLRRTLMAMLRRSAVGDWVRSMRARVGHR